MLYQATPTQDLYKPVIAIVQKQEKPKDPPKQLYTFKQDEVLERVATSQNTTVQRLYDKNPSITNPDVINVGQTIEIPSPDEQLTHREMPVSIEPHLIATSSPPSGGFSSSGNLYAAGNCTQYAKNRRPDLSNSLGNADTWLINARVQGFSTGVTPKVGSIAVARSYMHVAYVEKVEGDRVFVSEQNYQGFGIISSRWTTISEWQGYIY